MILFYNILLLTTTLLGFPVILIGILASAKLRRTLPCRLGLRGLPPDSSRRRDSNCRKKPVWIHALSVGEVLAAVPLAKELKANIDKTGIYFSVSTRTGYEIASRSLAGIVEAVFFHPYDLAFSVKNVIRRIDPALVVIVETDIWPNLLNEMKRRRVPVLLVNARLSKRSFASYKRFAFFSRWLFSGFTKICAQSRLDAERFRSLGVPGDRIAATGNVKFDQNDDPISIDQIERWRRRLKIGPGKKVWLAGSTHAGEEALVRDVFIGLRRGPMDLTLIAAPRDPRRVPEVVRLFGEAGLTTELVSGLSSDSAERPADAFIVDTIGDLRMLYALADVAFIGGSLVHGGGHNPLEPAAYSRPILFGPDMSDFSEVALLLLESGGALQVRNAAEMLAAVSMLMENSLKAQEVGRCAHQVFCDNKGAVGRNLEFILNELVNQ